MKEFKIIQMAPDTFEVRIFEPSPDAPFSKTRESSVRSFETIEQAWNWINILKQYPKEIASGII